VRAQLAGITGVSMCLHTQSELDSQFTHYHVKDVVKITRITTQVEIGVLAASICVHLQFLPAR